MGWIKFLSTATIQKAELQTASEGGSGMQLPVILIGVDDLDAAEKAVRAEQRWFTARSLTIGDCAASSSAIRRAISSTLSTTD
jgi:hypothetical protein